MSNEVNFLKKCFDLNPENSEPSNTDIALNYMELQKRYKELEERFNNLKILYDAKDETIEAYKDLMELDCQLSHVTNMCPNCGNWINYENNYVHYEVENNIKKSKFLRCNNCECEFKIFNNPDKYTGYTTEKIANKQNREIPLVRNKLVDLRNDFMKIWDSFKGEMEALSNEIPNIDEMEEY